VRRIDGGQLGGRWFFVVAGIGFDAHVAHAFDRSGRKRRGLATYARLAGVELWRYRCGQYNVNGSPRANVLLVTFANGAQFGNGARIAPSARVDDGQLDMVTVEERSRLSTLLCAPRLFWGGLERVPGITVQRVSHAVVESPVPMAFHVDGEPMQGSTRLEARVHPAVLWVASPARPDALIAPKTSRHTGRVTGC
jgi:diacylglycerol kinase family enzyme